jgi:hypothetical protein
MLSPKRYCGEMALDGAPRSACVLTVAASGPHRARLTRVQAMCNVLSAITLQELEIGVLLVGRRDQAQGALLRVWLRGHVLTAFRNRVLPVDTASPYAARNCMCPIRAPCATA